MNITHHISHSILRVVGIVALLFLLIGCNSRTSRVQQLIADSEFQISNDQPDSAWALLEEAVRYADQHHDALSKGHAFLAMARYQNMLDQPDSAIHYLHIGLGATTQHPSLPDSLLAQYYGELSASYIIVGDMRQAVDYGLKALPLMRRYADAEDMAVMSGNIGIAYRRIGMNDSASVHYREGLEVAMQAADHESQAYLSNNLSVLYAEMSRYEESVDYADKAAQAATLAGDNIERLSAQANKGVALLLNQQTDQAVEILTTAFQQADSTNSTALKLKTINYLLKALVGKHQWNEVARYLARGEQLAATLPAGNTGAAGILESKMIMLTEQGHYQQALETIAEIESLMAQQQVMSPYKLLANKARCLAALGNYREAYQLQSQAVALSDSLRSMENARKLDRLTTDYRVMEKELQLSRQQTLSERKTTLLAVALLTLTILLVAFLFAARQRRQQALMRETRKYVEGVEQERKRFAHELHDGACNDLLAIGMQLRSSQPDIRSVAGQVATLRAQLRNLSHELMPPQFAQGVHLNEALAHYLSHLEEPAVTFKAEGSGWEHIPADTAYQVYRIAQEAIGNIIAHQPTATVTVTLSLLTQHPSSTPQHPRLRIVSHGPIVPGDGKGIGIQSMRDRASSIGATLTVSSTADNCTLTLD